ncbi:PAS domain S-box protein [bacterium]|nr:PAS domain S-box protein [bacterium]
MSPSHDADAEISRLNALRELNVLDTGPEAGFDAIVNAVAAALGAPIALVSLIDEDRQWFKSRIGLDVSQTPRDIAFCDHAIRSADPLVITDARTDPRFAENPLVTGEPRIVSYLGAPLITSDGHALGTLCAIDRRRRDWTAQEVQHLRAIAEVVVELLRQRAAALDARRLSREVGELSAELAAKSRFLDEVTTLTEVGGWDVDVRSGAIHWTPITRRIYGVDETFHPTLTNVIEFYAPEAIPTVRETLENAVRNGQSWDIELPFITAQGQRIWVRAVGRPVRIDGRVTRLVGALQDVTQKRLERETLVRSLAAADRALSDLNAYRRALDRYSIVSVFDSSGKVLFANDRYCEVSGYAREELVGADDPLLRRDDHDEAMIETLRSTIRLGNAWHGVVCNRRIDGELYWLDTTVVPLTDTDGRPERFVTFGFDVTDRIRYEQELEIRRVEAESANAAKSAFLASMSHEIRTPLNGVIGIAGALARTSLDPHQQELVDLINSSGHVLDRLLTDLLDLSRAESGKIEIIAEPFDLAATITSSAMLHQANAETKGIALEVDLSPSVHGVVLGDGVRIGQIVANLVANAVKFTHAGRVQITADVSPTPSRPGHADLTVIVRDTGIGFDEASAERLFQRFEQGDAATHSRYGGAGLGLAICRALSDAMGGEISAVSTPGEGSVFTVRLPLALAEPASVATRPAPVVAPPPEAPAGLARSYRVLLAEDHPINQRVVSLVLESTGADITCASNGAQAVERFRTQAFDIVLMDIRMPEMGGLTAIRLIREMEAGRGGARTPIAVLTATTGGDDRKAALSAGADVVLVKPISPQALIEGVATLIAAGAPALRTA